MSYLQGQYGVELADILNEPLRALSESIIVTAALPIRQIISNLCDAKAMLQTLGLTESEKNGKG